MKQNVMLIETNETNKVKPEKAFRGYVRCLTGVSGEAFDVKLQSKLPLVPKTSAVHQR
ncbi:MAG: hypothetical protein K9K68_07895 [Methylococcaceae bacterium]|nr:hypothetical protein [Methylococcaceae bacterium]